MRIVQVIHWFLPAHSAGSEVYTAGLSQELAARHEVFIYCREDGHGERHFFEEDGSYAGLPVHRVYFNPRGGVLQLPTKALAQFRSPSIEASFARYLRQIKPDVVHFQHLFKLSGRLIRIAHDIGMPTVLTLHDYWMLCYNAQLLRPGFRACDGPLGGLRCPGCVDAPLHGAKRLPLYPVLWPFCIYRTRFLRRALSGADVIISPSAYLAETFIRHGLPRERIIVSDNGTDASWARDVQHIPADRVRFGYVGTLAPHKGAHILVDAFRGLDPTRAELRIYGGEGASGGYVEKLRGAAGEGVSFLGAFEHRQIARILSEIDVLVVPSLWPENSPVTIHEARAARVPVLAAEIGGMPHLVREGQAGWCFAPGDVGALRAAMARLVDDPGLIAQVRQHIRPVKKMADQAAELEAIYESLQRR